MMKKLFCIVLVIFMVFGLVACQSDTTTEDTTSAGTSASTGTSSGTSSTEVTMTDAGTPRAETLVIDMAAGGRWTGEFIFNPYISGCVYQGDGFRSLIWEHLWDVDSSTGEQVCVLAEDFPEAIDDTYTKFEVKLRQGVKWSDGVDFTADDLVYTSELLLSTPELTYSGAFSSEIKSITKVDDYTVLIETVSKEMRLSQFLGSNADTSFRILPKHIWENVDPLTYQYTECVGTGPYTLKSYDENGNYFLFEKREDVECSANAMVYGEPVPSYVLYESFGEAETQVMAAINNQVDLNVLYSTESAEILLAQNAEASTWEESSPYGRINGEPQGILFNCAAEPLDNVNIRWALILALNAEELSMTTYNGGARMCPIAGPAMDSTTEAYIKPIAEWLENFTLSDGYQPFNSNYAQEIAATLTEQGVEGLPTDEEELKDKLGIGWWKHDTAEAESLLLAEGFTRGSDGMWLKTDGTPWQITIANCGEEAHERLCYTIVNAWQLFGIDAVVSTMDNATFRTAESQGTADCFLSWLNNSELIDVTKVIRTWDSNGIALVGENTSGGYQSGDSARWASDEIDSVISELIELDPDDPRAAELIIEYFKVMVKDMPYVAIYGNVKINPVTTHYWTGFPDADNPYSTNCWWFSNNCKMLANIEPMGNQ